MLGIQAARSLTLLEVGGKGVTLQGGPLDERKGMVCNYPPFIPWGYCIPFIPLVPFTHTLQNPYPSTGVWVLEGMGKGRRFLPRGYPCYSLKLDEESTKRTRHSPAARTQKSISNIPRQPDAEQRGQCLAGVGGSPDAGTAAFKLDCAVGRMQGREQVETWHDKGSSNTADEGLCQTLENSSEREQLMLETTKTMEHQMQVEQKVQICENPAIEDRDQIASTKRQSHRGRQARCKLDKGAQEQTSTNTTQKEHSSTVLNAKPVQS
ncbi:hypothetical protein V8E53_012383 [Lactarius tabidus]